jgi:hypothetical protein
MNMYALDEVVEGGVAVVGRVAAPLLGHPHHVLHQLVQLLCCGLNHCKHKTEKGLPTADQAVSPALILIAVVYRWEKESWKGRGNLFTVFIHRLDGLVEEVVEEVQIVIERCVGVGHCARVGRHPQIHDRISHLLSLLANL